MIFIFIYWICQNPKQKAPRRQGPFHPPQSKNIVFIAFWTKIWCLKMQLLPFVLQTACRLCKKLSAKTDLRDWNTLKHVETQCELAPDFQQLKLSPREVACKHLPDAERPYSRKAWPNFEIAHLLLLFDVLHKSELLTDFKVKLSWTARVYKKPCWT